MSSTFTRGNPLHAKVYDALCGYMERRGLLEWRRRLVGDLTGDILEIGAGTGRNFAHYPAEATVYGSEFDPVMLSAGIARARDARADVLPLLADGSRLPFADHVFDVVVIGLALCSIPDPVAAVGEIRRVLRADGRFRFLEHVRGDPGTKKARMQDRVNPFWRAFSGGCNCNRRSADLVANAGFDLDSLARFEFGLPHTAPHVLGEARLR